MRFLVSVDGLLPLCPEECTPQDQLGGCAQISGGSLRRAGLATFGVPYYGRDALALEKSDALRTFGHAIAQPLSAMEAAGVGSSVPALLPEQTRKATKEAKSLLGRISSEGRYLGADDTVDAFGLKLRAQAVISLRRGYSSQTFRPFSCLMAACSQGQFQTVGDWLTHECEHTRQTDLAGILKLQHTRSLFLQALLNAPLAVRQEFATRQAREFDTLWVAHERAFTTSRISINARNMVFRSWE
jgi:hypothetical protein